MHLLPCCGQHLFGLAREPDFYRNMLCVLDRLHQSAHGACSPAYLPDLYLQLRRRNTQVCEQKNSLYVQKRAHFYAMSHFMFLFHLRYYTWARAQRSIAIHENVILARSVKTKARARPRDIPATTVVGSARSALASIAGAAAAFTR